MSLCYTPDMNSELESLSPTQIRLITEFEISSPTDKWKVLSLALSRLAAGYEAEHNSAEASKYWVKNHRYLEELINDSPQLALQFADFLASYPDDANPEREWNSRWLRG